MRLAAALVVDVPVVVVLDAFLLLEPLEPLELLEPPHAAIASAAHSASIITRGPRGVRIFDLMFSVSPFSYLETGPDQPPPNSEPIAEVELLVELEPELEDAPALDAPVLLAPESVTEVACTVPFELALPAITTASPG